MKLGFDRWRIMNCTQWVNFAGDEQQICGRDVVHVGGVASVGYSDNWWNDEENDN